VHRHWPPDGFWYLYPEPIYCDNPHGYYPYVASCNGPWREVRATQGSGLPAVPPRRMRRRWALPLPGLRLAQGWERLRVADMAGEEPVVVTILHVESFALFHIDTAAQ